MPDAAGQLTSTADAGAWLEAERANLVAAGCHPVLGVWWLGERLDARQSCR